MAFSAKDLSLAPTPPMGWNSWNYFRCDGLSEKVILETADALVASGMRDAGYHYLVVDDCWQAFTRDGAGRLAGHPERFPSGMERLGQEIHDRGLKFGLYLSPGRKTCAMIYDRYPGKDLGSYGFEQQDADLLAGWGVDYLKYDWCKADKGKTGLQYADAFGHMAQALTNTGRDMIFKYLGVRRYQALALGRPVRSPVANHPRYSPHVAIDHAADRSTARHSLLRWPGWLE